MIGSQASEEERDTPKRLSDLRQTLAGSQPYPRASTRTQDSVFRVDDPRHIRVRRFTYFPSSSSSSPLCPVFPLCSHFSLLSIPLVALRRTSPVLGSASSGARLACRDRSRVKGPLVFVFSFLYARLYPTRGDTPQPYNRLRRCPTRKRLTDRFFSGLPR